jgi:hypothetical protein
LAALVLCAGAAVDYLHRLKDITELQTAVDAAALSAAAHQGDEKTRRAAGLSAFMANYPHEDCVTEPEITLGANRDATVTASCNVPTAFLSLAGYDAMSVSVMAKAMRRAPFAACVLVLDPDSKETLYINSDSSIQAPDCVVHVNSTDPESLRGNSSGDIVSKKTCLAGGHAADKSSTFMPKPVACPALADPLASLPEPAAASGSCDHTDLVIKKSTTVDPGVYCKKTEVQNGVTVTFKPGIYIFRDGEFVVNSGATVLANSGVMFYHTGSNNARLNVNSGSHVEIKAPSSGPQAGIAVFQEHDSTADHSILNSDSSSRIEGVIYFPNTPLHLNSAGKLAKSAPWTIVIVKELLLNSHSVMHVKADFESSTVPRPEALGGATSSAVVRLTN